MHMPREEVAPEEQVTAMVAERLMQTGVEIGTRRAEGEKKGVDLLSL